MSIELAKEARADAIASIQQYFERNLTEPIGELPAGLLLDFFVEEIGPAIYNKAIADAQGRLASSVSSSSTLNYTWTSFSIGRSLQPSGANRDKRTCEMAERKTL